MPRRRLTLLPLALAATAALAAGCEIDIAPEAIPAPISIAPTPSASAGVPKYVCSAVYKTLTDGALKLAQYAASSSDEAKANMKRTFTDMAAQVDAEVARVSDPQLRTALQDISADLTAGAQQSDPAAYIEGDFQTVGQKLDGKCGE
ncbi:hypothetical protein Ade02nite_51100 [Paractinoplanes deccanensis]|uniref:Lipoprotein n=1 Tax=Paractinoplanes deccanensis TaxID=113561 RepID=A0ABQ3Y916_9ACTN|nr:hypothetical protein [Actinoplanes deccanensis]GID76469.1 hypothetical protein Ade02nite_51100 [Actinoplanes deccanensis]